MPDRVVSASAPVRVCDIGGWTDTWFAGSGAVFSIAVAPRVEARIVVRPAEAGQPQVALSAPDLGDRYELDLAAPPGRQPLLEAALTGAGVPAGCRIDVSVHAGVPPGCGTGTSAAVVVALLGALDRLTPGVTPPAELARAAHRVETERLGLQSGVQDQVAAACGGINLLEVRYPDTDVHPVPVDEAVRAALQERLLLVSLGHPHRSSAIHDEVIARLGGAGGRAPELATLRAVARRAASAVADGDLEGLGAAMRASTEAQRDLHASLVSDHAQAVLDAAAAAGASGWKVNGAGGDGGSLTLLAGPGPGDPARLSAALAGLPGAHRVIPIELAAGGLEVTDTGPEGPVPPALPH